MAGAKETPRQKMIGMMYLVLTALLALNVAKSILDAFVAIEENIQKASLTELYHGDEKRDDLQEMRSDKSNPTFARRAEIMLQSVHQIDKMTAERIKLIDDIKLEILNQIGEDTKTVAPDHAIIVSKYDDQNPLKPARMNLSFVNGKDKYDDPMRIMLGDKTDIKRPGGRGKELWNSLVSYRKELTEKIAGSHVRYIKEKDTYALDNRYSFDAPEINEFKNQRDLDEKLSAVLRSSKAHPDDRQPIAEIYRSLTKEELSEVHSMTDVHWIGKTFDHSPTVAAIASLSSLQKEILAARAQALTLIRNRIGGNPYTFNSIMALAYGPEVVNSGDAFTVEVLVAAYDSDAMPEITFGNQTISDVRDGKGFIKTKASGSKMELKGTISIRDKSGVKKTMDWKKEVYVMKPSGSIEIPGMNVLYRGYENIVNATASGFPETVLTPSGASITRSGENYIIKPTGNSRKAYLSVSGKTKDGRTVQLKRVEYRVLNLPQPSMYWGAVKEGGKVPGVDRNMFMRYDETIPLDATFPITSWEMSVAGAQGTVNGTSNKLTDQAIQMIRAAPRGTMISFSCWIKEPSEKKRRKTASFFKQ